MTEAGSPASLDVQKRMFEAPSPTRVQRAALNVAGRLLGEGGGADPLVVMESVAVQVGGFEPDARVNMTGKPNHVKTYIHPEGGYNYTAAAQDETTRSGSVASVRGGREHTDMWGGHIDTVLTATVDKRRATGPLAKTLRGRAARSLTGRAIKGVGSQSHLNKGKEKE